MNYVWITILGVACFGGVVWIGWSIIDLIRYMTISDEKLQQKTFPKPRITLLAQEHPAKCRAFFVRFNLVFLVLSIAITVGTGWAFLKVFNNL